MELERQHIELLTNKQDFQHKRLEYAVEYFKKYKFLTPEAGDIFFETFCIGNDIYTIHMPLNRFNDYQKVLELIYHADQIKYLQIHKGTPFYFLSWLAFQIQSYERAVFYMDAAIAEDIRKTIFKHRKENPLDNQSDEDLAKSLFQIWIRNASGQFFMLYHNQHSYPTAATIIQHLEDLWHEQFKRFESISGYEIVRQNFLIKFIGELAPQSAATRSIITALYSFILEYNEVLLLIKLRSVAGGSIEPITTFLLKGCLIFESLLKYRYPLMDNGTVVQALSNLAGIAAFRAKYGIQQLQTSSGSINAIITSIGTNTDVQTAFNTTGKIRNTTGHNLNWDDVFNDPANFETLFTQIMNAILYIYVIDFS